MTAFSWEDHDDNSKDNMSTLLSANHGTRRVEANRACKEVALPRETAGPKLVHGECRARLCTHKCHSSIASDGFRDLKSDFFQVQLQRLTRPCPRCSYWR